MLCLFRREGLGLDRSSIAALHLIFQDLEGSLAGQVLLLDLLQPVLGDGTDGIEIDIALISALLQFEIIAGLEVVGSVGSSSPPPRLLPPAA